MATALLFQQGCSVPRSSRSPHREDNRAVAVDEQRCHSDSDDDGHVYFDDYRGKLMESVYNWNFQIFDLSDGTPFVLSQVSEV